MDGRFNSVLHGWKRYNRISGQSGSDDVEMRADSACLPCLSHDLITMKLR